MQTDLPRGVYLTARWKQDARTGVLRALCPIRNESGQDCPGFLGDVRNMGNTLMRTPFDLFNHALARTSEDTNFDENWMAGVVDPFAWVLKHPHGYWTERHGDVQWFHVVAFPVGRRKNPKPHVPFPGSPLVIGRLPLLPCVVFCPKHGKVPIFVPAPDCVFPDVEWLRQEARDRGILPRDRPLVSAFIDPPEDA